MITLDTLLENGFIRQSPSRGDLDSRLSAGNVSIFYGETFDFSGNPVDSLRFYFMCSDLSRIAQHAGSKATAHIVIADSAVDRNETGPVERITEAADSRLRFARRAQHIFDLDYEIVPMSSYLESNEFIDLRDELAQVVRSNPHLRSLLERTVPSGQLERERKEGFMYTFDELASIAEMDIKVGPPREEVYDSLAREIQRIRERDGPLSIFLPPSFPLGMPWTWFYLNQDLEHEGITAYKAGSRNLQAHRILDTTSADEAHCLIQKSMIPRDPSLPNPLLNLGLIAERARYSIDGNEEFSLYRRTMDGVLQESALRTEVNQLVIDYLLEPLHNG